MTAMPTLELVPCLLEERVKEQYNKELVNATDDEVKKAQEYVMKRDSATLLLIGRPRMIQKSEESTSAKYGNGYQQLPKMSRWNNEYTEHIC